MKAQSKLIMITILFFHLCPFPHLFAAEPPYPSSQVIDGIIWDDPSTIVRKAYEPPPFDHTYRSDNWPITWAADGHQYAAWGDGRGFGGPDAGLGVARISGSPENFTGTNMWSVPRGYTGGKSYGILSLDGVLYMWAGPHSTWTAHTETWLMWSNDNGQNWHASEIFFRYTDGFSLPTFLNFGKDYDGARDNYVYVYAHDASNGEGGPWTKVNLARAPKSSIKNRPDYRFFAGLDSDDNPIWTSDISKKAPVFTDMNGTCFPSVVYNADIKRYLLVLPHIIADGGRGYGSLGIFEAPEPWGPWNTVYYTDSFLGDSTLFFATISSKWITNNGRTIYLIFTGYGTGVARDAYQHIRGTLTIFGETDPPPPPANLRILQESYRF